MPPSLASSYPQAAHQAALHRRLEQLRTAMGESTDPMTHQAPITHPLAPVSTKAGAPPLLLIGSTLLIAGALWWAFGAGTHAANAMAVADTGPLPQAPATARPSLAQTTVVAATPAVPPQTKPVLDEQQIRDALENWRLDWSRRDVEAYLRHYSPSFEPVSDQTRAEWEASRRKNISSRPAIRVELNDLRIEPLDERQVRVSFLQSYISGTYQESAQPKTMRLVQEDLDWRIVGEWQGSELRSQSNPR